MISYLQCLSDKCHKAPICLIWDQFKAHLTQDNYTNQYKLIIIRFWSIKAIFDIAIKFDPNFEFWKNILHQIRNNFVITVWNIIDWTCNT